MLYGSLRAFLTRLIDYAGLFPPASLSLDVAFQNYVRYRREPDAWMLGRFVCPAVRLAELAPLLEASAAAATPFAVAALGRKGVAAAFDAELAADLGLIAAARKRHGPALLVDVLELPLPPGDVTAQLLARLAEATAAADLAVFCEASATVDAGWERAQLQVIEALNTHNATGAPPLALKLRTGGVSADAFPSPQQLAAVLVAARDAGLALKCTAGLHHPFRQFRGEVGTQMHGFVNLFAAGLLAHAHSLDVATVAQIIADEQPKAFVFSVDALAWREAAIKSDAIKQLRHSALISYGSCSFDEPRDDLRALGILPATT